LAAGCWLLAFGYWLSGCWLLATNDSAFWLLNVRRAISSTALATAG